MSSLLVRLEKLSRALLTPRHAPRAQVRRILIAHQLLLGDTLLLAPLLKRLQALYPDAERVLLVRPGLMPLFTGRPYGVTALPFSRRDGLSQRRVMHSGPYDLALVPDDNRYSWLARAAGARWIRALGQDVPAWKNWMVDQALGYPDAPMAWADLAARLADAHAPSSLAPAFYLPGEWPAPKASAALALPDRPYVVLHVAASSVLKAWPAARWNELAEHLRAHHLLPVFSGGPTERQWLAGIRCSDAETAWFGQLELNDLWHLLAHARALVCLDTGVAHLARLIGVPTVALFGPGSSVLHGAGQFFADAPFSALTSMAFPCRDQRTIFRRQVAWVRRCGRAAGRASHQCPAPLCMQAVAAAEVLDALDRALRTSMPKAHA